MKLVNWRYPEARVWVHFDKGAPFAKNIRRAIGVIVGQHFFGWMRADDVARRIGECPLGLHQHPAVCDALGCSEKAA